jgi:hypothetical protein
MLLFKIILIAILLYYVLICALTFILHALSISKTKFANNYKIIYSALLKENNLLYNNYKRYSNPLPQFSQNENAQCTGVNRNINNAWSLHWQRLIVEAFNNPFRFSESLMKETLQKQKYFYLGLTWKNFQIKFPIVKIAVIKNYNEGG